MTVISGLATALAVLAAPASVSAQCSAHEFEVASVKPSVRDFTRAPMRIDAARVEYDRLSAKLLVQLALRVEDYQLSGGPGGWSPSCSILRQRCRRAARSRTCHPFCKKLLADRFHLVFERQTAQVSGFELVVAKGGPKLKPGKETEQWSGALFRGGIQKGRIELYHHSMGGLASTLAHSTGAPVVDATRLNGFFDISLKWTPDETLSADPAAKGPSLYTALEEQLGLKLRPAKVKVERIRVVQIDRPGGN